MHLHNYPQHTKSNDRGFYEVWYLKLNVPLKSAALWIRFTTLRRADGSKNIAEIWALFSEFESHENKFKKSGIKCTYPVSQFTFDDNTDDSEKIKIQENILGKNSTSGSVTRLNAQPQLLGQVQNISWNLHFEPNDFTFFHVPPLLTTLGLAGSQVCKPNVNIRFNGHFTIDNRRFELTDTAGCQGHIWGRRYAHRWAWAHCNLFDDPSAVVEVLTGQVKLAGLIPTPQLSALFVEMHGKKVEFNSLSDAFAIESHFRRDGWSLRAVRQSLRLEYEINTSPQAMTGVTYEDTDGSLLYCHNTAFANSILSVYEGSSLIKKIHSQQTTSFEVVSRLKLPLVEFVL